MIAKRKLYIFGLSVVIIAIFAGIICLIVYRHQDTLVNDPNQDQQSEIAVSNNSFRTVEGQFYGYDSKKVFLDTKLYYGQKELTISPQGLFIIADVKSDEFLRLQNPHLPEELNISLTELDTIQIYINQDFYRLHRQIERLEQNRKYKDLYQLLSTQQQQAVNLDEFVRKKNEWRDNIIDKNDYEYFKLQFDYSQFEYYENKGLIKAKLDYQWSKNQENWDSYPVFVEFMKQDNNWKINSLLTW